MEKEKSYHEKVEELIVQIDKENERLERKNGMRKCWEDLKIEMLKTNEQVYKIWLQNVELIKSLDR